MEVVKEANLIKDNPFRDGKEQDILKQGDLSLRAIKAIKSGRKVKKQMEEKYLPTRIQPNRSAFRKIKA